MPFSAELIIDIRKERDYEIWNNDVTPLVITLEGLYNDTGSIVFSAQDKFVEYSLGSYITLDITNWCLDLWNGVLSSNSSYWHPYSSLWYYWLDVRYINNNNGYRPYNNPPFYLSRSDGVRVRRFLSGYALKYHIDHGTLFSIDDRELIISGFPDVSIEKSFSFSKSIDNNVSYVPLTPNYGSVNNPSDNRKVVKSTNISNSLDVELYSYNYFPVITISYDVFNISNGCLFTENEFGDFRETIYQCIEKDFDFSAPLSCDYEYFGEDGGITVFAYERGYDGYVYPDCLFSITNTEFLESQKAIAKTKSLSIDLLEMFSKSINDGITGTPKDEIQKEKDDMTEKQDDISDKTKDIIKIDLKNESSNPPSKKDLGDIVGIGLLIFGVAAVILVVCLILNFTRTILWLKLMFLIIKYYYYKFKLLFLQWVLGPTISFMALILTTVADGIDCFMGIIKSAILYIKDLIRRGIEYVKKLIRDTIQKAKDYIIQKLPGSPSTAADPNLNKDLKDKIKAYETDIATLLEEITKKEKDIAENLKKIVEAKKKIKGAFVMPSIMPSLPPIPGL